MNPNLCRVALRPRGPLEVFDLALRLVRAHPAVTGRLAVLCLVPPIAAITVGIALTSGVLAWILAPLAVAPLVQLPFTLLGGRLLFAADVTARQVLSELVQRRGAVAAVIGLYAAMLFGGCGFFTPVLGLLYGFIPEVALLERGTGFGIGARAWRLFWHNPGISLAWASLFLFGSAWGAVVGEFAGQAIVDTVLQLGTPFGNALDGDVTPYACAGVLAVQPVLGFVRLLLFVDLRTRTDAWDLQVGLRAAALRDAP